MNKLLVAITSLNKTNGQIMSHRTFKGNINTTNKNLEGILLEQSTVNENEFIPENVIVFNGKYNNNIILTLMKC